MIKMCALVYLILMVLDIINVIKYLHLQYLENPMIHKALLSLKPLRASVLEGPKMWKNNVATNNSFLFMGKNNGKQKVLSQNRKKQMSKITIPG